MSNCFSSEQFRKQWRYAVEKDFTKEGVEASFVKGHPSTWGNESNSIKLEQRLRHGAFSPDERFLAVGSGSSILIYSTRQNFRLCSTLNAPSIQAIEHLEWRPKVEYDDGYMLLAAVDRYGDREEQDDDGDTRSKPCSILWSLDASAQNRLSTSETPVNVDAVAGLAAQEVGSLLQTRYNWAPSEANSPNILKGMRKVLVKARAKHAEVNCKTVPGFPFGFDSSCFSHSGRFIILETEDETKEDEYERRPNICVWDVSNVEPTKKFTLSGHTDSLMWAGFSPDDSMIASSCWDQTLKLWSTTTGDLLYSLGPSGGQNWTGAFSPDGKLVVHGVGGSKPGLMIWNTTTGERVLVIDDAAGWVRAFAWSPDSNFLAFGAEDGELRIIRVQGGADDSQEPGMLVQKWRADLSQFGSRGFRSFVEVRDVSWFDDGKKISFSTGCDNGIDVYDMDANCKWRFESPKDIGDKLTWNQRGEGRSLWWKEGRMFLTFDLDNSVRFWPLN